MSVLNLLRWECFKLQRRKMSWILLAILLGFTQLAVWGSYVGYSSNVASGGRVFVPQGFDSSGRRMIACTELQGDAARGLPGAIAAGLNEQCRVRGAALARQYQALSPAGGASLALGVIGSLGLILFGILTASMVGSEYGFGTLRPILARGTGRLSYLAGKYLTLVAVATAAAILCSALGAASGLLASQSAPPPPAGTAALLAALDTSPAISVTFLKNWGALLAFITLTGAITVLLRSTAAGMAICLAWFAGEALLIRLMSAVFTNFDAVADFLPMRNISALTRSGIPSPFSSGNELGTLHASLVLAAYAIAFAGLAILLFRRRDIAGAAGG